MHREQVLSYQPSLVVGNEETGIDMKEYLSVR
jgi:hypothetical protein